MPDLPWTVRAEMEPGTGYLVMASYLPLKRITGTVRFFRGVSAVRKQLAAADGLIGYTLRANRWPGTTGPCRSGKTTPRSGSSCAPLRTSS